jgi:hypothetical protein
MAVLGKRGVVGNLLVKTQTGEPTISQMHPYFFHQTPFAGDPIKIADHQQAEQHFGIDGWSVHRAVASCPF